MKPATFAFAALAVVLLSEGAHAECIARHAVTGKPVRAKEVNVPRLDYWATATFPKGHPTITYGPEFYRLAPVVQEFSKLHECAHLSIPTSDETRVNCVALTTMRERGLSAVDEAAIERAHVQYERLGPRYGGSGREYWRRTMECAGPRKTVVPDEVRTPCPGEMNARYTEALKRERVSSAQEKASVARAVREEAQRERCDLRLTIIR